MGADINACSRKGPHEMYVQSQIYSPAGRCSRCVMAWLARAGEAGQHKVVKDAPVGGVETHSPAARALAARLLLEGECDAAAPALPGGARLKPDARRARPSVGAPAAGCAAPPGVVTRASSAPSATAGRAVPCSTPRGAERGAATTGDRPPRRARTRALERTPAGAAAAAPGCAAAAPAPPVAAWLQSGRAAAARPAPAPRSRPLRGTRRLTQVEAQQASGHQSICKFTRQTCPRPSFTCL